jgi:glucose/arabinose dehydrogenase
MPTHRLTYLATALLLPILCLAAEVSPFSGTLKLSGLYAQADGNPVYDLVPLTVELRAKLQRKTGVNTLIANGLKISIRHWQLYAARDSGFFTAFLPGCNPPEIASKADIVDGKWHFLAMTFDGTTVKLFVDGSEVASQGTKANQSYADTSPLTFGYYPDVPPPGDIELDEVRLSHTLRPVTTIPGEPFKLDADTIGLWHFDEPNPDTGFEDLSRTHNPVRLMPFPPPGDGVQSASKTRWSDMDFGPFFSSTLGAPLPKGNITHKAISIRLGKDAAVAFDTELLRVSCAWTGDFIKIHPNREGLAEHPDVAGTALFGTAAGPGWAKPGTQDFTDPRKDKLGPLPRDWARYRGLYRNGDQTVLSYTVGATDVFESQSYSDGRLTRILNLGPSTEVLALRLCSLPSIAKPLAGEDSVVSEFNGHMPAAIWDIDGKLFTIGVVGGPLDRQGTVGMSSGLTGGDVVVKFPASQSGSYCRVMIESRTRAEVENLKKAQPTTAAVRVKDPIDLKVLTRGGPPRYPAPLETKGTLGDAPIANRKSEISNLKSQIPAPYVVDTLTSPEDNPQKSFLRFSGLDFFSNGDIAVCSISGDVWRVSGIDEKLEHLKWRRFATGLHQPLGLKIVNDRVYVLGRDQITRLHDLNGDGEADFYENFNNDCKVTTNGHAYTANLERDPRTGEFFYTKGADGSEHGGTILRVSADGSNLDVAAVGLRFSNGLGIGPHGELTEADNEGEWVPASRIDWVKEPGQFLGYTPMAHQSIAPTDPGRPLCWMPKNIDNSASSQIWVASDKWGPFAGDMLHTSYGQASLLHVMYEEVNGQIQGGVTKFPLTFDSGIMRGRFSPKDGQLYVCGLRGWQTRGNRFTTLQRVRFTGQPVRMPAALHVHKNGVRISFTCELDPASVDADAFGVIQWNYKWSSTYGSRHWSALNPEKQGYDTLEVKSAKLLADGKSVFLEIPGIQPVMQMQITYTLHSRDGAAVKGDIYNTMHELAPAFP